MTSDEYARAIRILQYNLRATATDSEVLYWLEVCGDTIDDRRGFVVAARHGLVDLGERPTLRLLGRIVGRQDGLGPLSVEQTRMLYRQGIRILREAASREFSPLRRARFRQARD